MKKPRSVKLIVFSQVCGAVSLVTNPHRRNNNHRAKFTIRNVETVNYTIRQVLRQIVRENEKR